MKNFQKAETLLACLLLAPFAFGQFETSEVLGTVRDASDWRHRTGKRSVTLLNQATGIRGQNHHR